MKKIVFCILAVLLAATLALLVYVRRPVVLANSKSPELVPADTLVYVQLADVEQTRARWHKTALFKIAHEPEVMAFLEKPESKIPQDAEVHKDIERAKKVSAKEAFFAITAIGAGMPTFVGGFDFKGSRSDAQGIVDDLKSKLKTEYPAGKSDLVQYNSREIETFSFDGGMIASVFKDRWFFVADNLDLLKSTLDRLDGKAATPSLHDSASFKSSLVKLPSDPDAVLYLAHGLFDNIATLLSVAGPNPGSKQADAIKKIEAVSAGLKLDGENIRDAVYVMEPSEGQAPLARNSLAYTTPQTLFYFATALHLDQASAPALPNVALDSTGVLALLGALQQALTEAGLTFDDFKASFGPEFGTIVDWPANVMQPSLLLTLDVKEKAKAAKFLDSLTSGQVGPAWSKQEIDGVTYFSQPPTAAGFVAVTPVLALTGKSLIFGLSADSVKSAVQNESGGTDKLDKTAGYKTTAGSLTSPTNAYGYIDSKALFEQVYGIASKTLSMMALFNPHANDYADLSKLPATAAISQHLTPIGYSISSGKDGLLVESVGPITFNDAAFAAAFGFAVEKLAQPSITPRQFQPQAAPAQSVTPNASPVP